MTVLLGTAAAFFCKGIAVAHKIGNFGYLAALIEWARIQMSFFLFKPQYFVLHIKYFHFIHPSVFAEYFYDFKRLFGVAYPLERRFDRTGAVGIAVHNRFHRLPKINGDTVIFKSSRAPSLMTLCVNLAHSEQNVEKAAPFPQPCRRRQIRRPFYPRLQALKEEPLPCRQR